MPQPPTTREHIELQLRLGRVPTVDNVAVLREMGFEPIYPHMTDGYHEKLWGRQVESEAGAAGLKQRAIQRAFLDEAKAEAA